MKKTYFILSAMILSLALSCGTTRTVPLTGRKQSLMVSDSEILSLSKQEYSKYMKTAKVSVNTEQTAMVKRVGKKLASAVENYFRQNGMTEEINNYDWEFNLVQDKGINAFCMPGGKIVVYEGLLPVTRDEASLAIVLGHEIAHAVARHSAEQMSKALKQQSGTQILGQIAQAVGVSSSAISIGEMVAQTGFQFQNLSYSRKHEHEADRMGLIFAAMAGYNPQAATSFWQRMAAQSGSGTPEFLSSHPSDANRISNIQKWMPEAQKYYKPITSATTTPKNKPTNKKSNKRR
ncbi:MAG: M48 family metallopeptidase [Prevotella sp.]|nr:M48 family metallopeptidase [Prevotella sp.]